MLTLCVNLVHCSPKVDFCGYSIPHPSESALQLRLQTRGVFSSTAVLATIANGSTNHPPNRGGVSAVGTSTADEVLEEGLRSLKEICSHVRDTFEEAVATHEAENGSGGAGGGAGVTADTDMS